MYNKIMRASFIERPNRFIAICNINGKNEVCHVKNTGRCKELLVPGATVILEQSDNPNRKTKFDLVAVYKGDNLINMDSSAPNKAVGIWLNNGGIFKNPTLVKAEVKYNKSRFDFYIEENERKAFVEVKGVTLENDGVAMFPDAPTQRGTKHINELIDAKNNGFESYIVFVVQMQGVNLFKPNSITDLNFTNALQKASEKGVSIIVVDCIVKENNMIIDSNVEFQLY